MSSYGSSAPDANQGVDLVELDRKVRELWASRWLAPAVTAGSLPRVPQMTALPTASVSYEGRLLYVPYASGVAGKCYICLLAADGATWNWVQLDNTAVDLSAIDFLVGTASGLLSAEIVAGAAPGGELGGTWPAPTVDATHSGSAHAVILRGSNTVEATTTSTGAVDLLTISSLNIPATSGIIIKGVARKSSGAAAAAGVGYSINGTVISEASIGTNHLWMSSTTNQAESGAFMLEIQPRSANYTNSYLTPSSGTGAAGAVLTFTAAAAINPLATAAFPTAAVTSIALRGISGNASVTLAVREFGVYEVVYQ